MDGSGFLAAHLGGHRFVYNGQRLDGSYYVKAEKFSPPLLLGMRIFTVSQIAVGVIDHAVAKHLLVGGAAAAK